MKTNSSEKILISNINNVKLNTSIGEINFDTCLMNASGAHCTSHKELQELMDSHFVGAVVSKSCTLNYRQGNPKPRYYHDHTNYNGSQPAFSINSTGLANMGIKEYLYSYNKSNSFKNKPYIISIAGLSLDENLSMLDFMENEIINCANDTNFLPECIELNLSCPNVIGKAQVGYDFDASENVLRKVFEQSPEMLLGVKLPPYFDFVHYDKMTDVLEQFPIQHITCINSLGNGLVIDWVNESTMIKPKGGFGGMGGSIVKPFALANVRKFSQLLPGIPIIGCGGVRTGWDAFEHILAGASMVQIGTQLMIEGVSCFERISKELKVLMQMKGYSCLDDFKGCLQEYPEIMQKLN